MATISKPALDLASEALKFATESTSRDAPDALGAIKKENTGKGKGRPKKTAPRDGNTRIFFAPEGDKRLTINIREDLHKRLKIAAINQGKTAGDIIEELLEANI